MKHSISGRALVALLAVVLVIGCVAGGTVAYLVSKTDTITNTFTVGDIKAELTETTGNTYHIVPGVNITKNPKATIKADSEDCYLFVKVDETNWPDVKNGDARKVDYQIADGWTKLEDGVYYREVGSNVADQDFPILKDNQVTVSDTLTKTDVEAIKAAGEPTLKFTVYAVQQEKVESATAAWNLVKPQN